MSGVCGVWAPAGVPECEGPRPTLHLSTHVHLRAFYRFASCRMEGSAKDSPCPDKGAYLHVSVRRVLCSADHKLCLCKVCLWHGVHILGPGT